MSNNVEHQVKEYLKKIKKGVSDYGANGDEIAEDLETNISYFLAKYPNAKFSDIEEEFGTANSIIDGFYSPDGIANARLDKNIIKIALIAGAVIAALIIIILW